MKDHTTDERFLNRKFRTDRTEFELIPFLRSPGGCLVMTLCMMVGGCIGCLKWLEGENEFVFDCGNSRTILVFQKRDKEFDRDTTHSVRVVVSSPRSGNCEIVLPGTFQPAQKFTVRLDSTGRFAGIIDPEVLEHYLCLCDFESGVISGSGPFDSSEEQRFREIEERLKQDPQSRQLTAR